MRAESLPDIYGGRNPFEIPAYSIPEGAHYLQLPQATVRSWVLGRTYPTEGGTRQFLPVIAPADPKARFLSFRNLVEIHVLSAIRRQHAVKLPEIRKAIRYLQKNLGTDHPLADRQMLTDGKHLFVEHYGKLVNVSQNGQLVMKQVIESYLRRIERDLQGIPIRLYPFTNNRLDSPRSVVIDPRVQFGRPCLAGTGIPTGIIVERYKAGDTIQLLAKDYGRPQSDIEEAIRYELPEAA